MRRATLAVCLLAVASSGCWQTSSVFERRYVRIEIPEYAAKDYLRLLDSENPDLRYLALSNLIEDKLTEGEAVSKKLGVLLQDPSPKVRAIAAFSAKSLDLSVSTFEPRLITLSHDPSSEVRLEAVAALGKYCGASDKVAQAILPRIEDKSVFVRLQAIDTLSNCVLSSQGVEIAHHLLAELPKRPQLEQLMIIRTLGSLGQGEKAVESTLLSLLNSSEDPILTVAAEALGGVKSAAAVQPLLESIQKKRGNAEVMVAALAAIGTPEAVQALGQLLHTEDDKLRVVIIEAIEQTEGGVGLAELVEQFTQQEARIQKDVDTVKWADFKANYPELLALLGAIHRKRFVGLDKFVGPPVAQFLTSEKDYEQRIALRLLADGQPYDRVIVASIEGKRDMFPQLESLCNHPAPLMRVFALRALGNTVDSRAVPILEAAVKEASFGIRYAAIQALGRYAQNTGDYSPLSRLYAMKESVVPSTYTSEDKEFLIRALIGTTLAEVERAEVTRQRRMAELSPSSSRPTRLMAALEDNTGLPVLFEFLETGIPAEKQAALNGIERFAVPSTDTISKLRELKAKEQDEYTNKKLGQLIVKLQAK